MVRFLPRILILTLIFLSGGFAAKSQDLTGIWRGYFITEMGEQYKLEFQVMQNPSRTVTGVSYSYLDVRFYGKATMSGHYIKNTKEFRIQEIKTVEVKSTTGGGTCIMNYKFQFVHSGNEEFLEGSYLGKSEDRLNPENNGKWGDCGGGKVFLRRVKTSEFYVEPFLRDKPIARKPPVNNRKPAIKKPADQKTNPVVKNKDAQKQKDDPVKKIEEPASKEPVKKEITKTQVEIPPILKSRENTLVKTFEVSVNEITVKLYDNGVIDDDTISIYLDKKLVLANKRLSTVPLTVTFKMADDQQEHELVMVAENLGRIPPNTSLMIVNAGEERYQVHITSTDQKNAVVRFIYKRPR
jgi:hypothetical protein